jgi:peptidoglycan/xylan/chitin deacetylase (PgdA/CDA1 family)
MMMRMPGRKYARRALRPLRRLLFPGAVVLGYHRIADPGWDPLGIAVSPERFAAQLEVLQGVRKIIGLAELAARYAAGERLDHYAVLTFDDGYRDFATTVLPLLARFDVPATVFVATGFTGRSFWWEEISALLRPGATGALPLEVRMNGADPLRFYGMEQADARAAAARDLCDRLACAGAEKVAAVLGQLREWAGEPGAGPDGVPLETAELEALARHPLAEIGAHTVSHGCLAQLSAAAQRAEIGRSKAGLEAMTGAPVAVFSYPNGSFATETPALVAELGFSCACTSMDGMFTRRGDPYRIPRLWAPDAGAPEFRRWLAHWVVERR